MWGDKMKPYNIIVIHNDNMRQSRRVERRIKRFMETVYSLVGGDYIIRYVHNHKTDTYRTISPFEGPINHFEESIAGTIGIRVTKCQTNLAGTMIEGKRTAPSPFDEQHRRGLKEAETWLSKYADKDAFSIENTFSVITNTDVLIYGDNHGCPDDSKWFNVMENVLKDNGIMNYHSIKDAKFTY